MLSLCAFKVKLGVRLFVNLVDYKGKAAIGLFRSPLA